jgi:hypothetical protein
MATRVYRKDQVRTPTVSEIEPFRPRISEMLHDGYSITAIIRKMGWGNDIPLRSWLKSNPELDLLRTKNGIVSQYNGSIRCVR